jgi:hypothetical protein
LISRQLELTHGEEGTLDLLDALRSVLSIPRGQNVPSAQELARWFERSAGAWFGPYYLHKIEGPEGLHRQYRTRMFVLEHDPMRETEQETQNSSRPLGPEGQVEIVNETDAPF